MCLDMHSFMHYSVKYRFSRLPRACCSVFLRCCNGSTFVSLNPGLLTPLLSLYAPCNSLRRLNVKDLFMWENLCVQKSSLGIDTDIQKKREIAWPLQSLRNSFHTWMNIKTCVCGFYFNLSLEGENEMREKHALVLYIFFSILDHCI